MRWQVLSMSFVNLVMLGGCTTTRTSTVKSSEIPARREFALDSAIDPCTDFFGYTCNKVIDGFALREDRSSHTLRLAIRRKDCYLLNRIFLHHLGALSRKLLALVPPNCVMYIKLA